MMKLQKFILILIISVLANNFSNAQKIKEENGLITLDGKPYVKMIKTKAWLVYNDFTIQNLSGIDLVTFNYRTKMRKKWNEEQRRYVEETVIYYTAKFTESGAHVVINEQLSKKMVVKILFKNKLVKDDLIDQLTEKQYVNRMGGTYPKKLPIHQSKSPVVIKGNLITIDERVVGKFIEKYSDSTKTTLVISVYANNSEKIAEAKVLVSELIEWDVKILIDDKSTSILYDSPEEKEKLFKWLVQKKYLK